MGERWKNVEFGQHESAGKRRAKGGSYEKRIILESEDLRDALAVRTPLLTLGRDR